jgi:hypothetical protein
MSDEAGQEKNDPRADGALLRRLHPLGEVGEAEAGPKPTRPPVGARCEKCGSTTVSAMPYFAAGSGLAFRPIANDLCCQRCGHIGPADFA